MCNNNIHKVYILKQKQVFNQFLCCWINGVRNNLKLRLIPVYQLVNDNLEVEVARRVACDYRDYNGQEGRFY